MQLSGFIFLRGFTMLDLTICWIWSCDIHIWDVHEYTVFLCTSVIRTTIDVIKRLIAVKYEIANSNFVLKIILWKRYMLVNLFLFSKLFAIASFIVTNFYNVLKYLEVLAIYLPGLPSFMKKNIEEVEKVFYFAIL